MSDDDENHLIAERRVKLGKLRDRGIAYPNQFRRNALAADLQTAYGAKSAEFFEAEALPVSDGPSAASASRRVARASRILALALATSELPATASAISSSSSGSLKARHHASSEAAGVEGPRPSTAACVHCAGSVMSGFA